MIAWPLLVYLLYEDAFAGLCQQPELYVHDTEKLQTANCKVLLHLSQGE